MRLTRFGVDVEVEVVGYGRPATLALARRVAAAKAAGHPLGPVTVVAETDDDAVATMGRARRLLG